MVSQSYRRFLILASLGTAAWLPVASALAQVGPTSANDRTTSQNQDPNPRNPTKPPKVNTGIGSPDTPTDGILNEGSPPIGAGVGAVPSNGQNAGQRPGQSAGASGNIGFGGGGLQTLRLSELLSADIQLQGGQGVGTVSDLVLNQNGSLLYLLGTNTTNQQMFTLPVQAVNFNADNLALTLSMTAQQFQALPTFTSNAIPNFSSLAYQQQISTAFGLAGVNGSSTGFAGAAQNGQIANQNDVSTNQNDVSNSAPVGTGRNGQSANPTNATNNAAAGSARNSQTTNQNDPNRGQNRTPGANTPTDKTGPSGGRRPPLDQPAHTQGNAQRNPATKNAANNNGAAANAKAGRTPAGTPLPNATTGNAAGGKKPAPIGGNKAVNPPPARGPGGSAPKANQPTPTPPAGAAPGAGNPGAGNPGAGTPGGAGSGGNPR